MFWSENLNITNHYKFANYPASHSAKLQLAVYTQNCNASRFPSELKIALKTQK